MHTHTDPLLLGGTQIPILTLTPNTKPGSATGTEMEEGCSSDSLPHSRQAAAPAHPSTGSPCLSPALRGSCPVGDSSATLPPPPGFLPRWRKGRLRGHHGSGGGAATTRAQNKPEQTSPRAESLIPPTQAPHPQHRAQPVLGGQCVLSLHLLQPVTPPAPTTSIFKGESCGALSFPQFELLSPSSSPN